MKNNFLTSLIFLSFSILANAKGADVISSGIYHLSSSKTGQCPTQIKLIVDMKNQVQIGAYSDENPTIIFQLSNINEGPRTWVTENPMFGQITGYQSSESIVKTGAYANSFSSVDTFGNAIMKTTVNGKFTKNSISIKNVSYNREHAELNYALSCVYKK